MIRRPNAVALVRALNLTFFLATCVYGLLTYNPFTYEQFITPHVSAALTNFAVWHADIHVLVLSLTTLTMAPFLERSRARWIGWSYLAGSLLLGVWFFTHPLWLMTDRSWSTLAISVVATLPPMWLALFDHLAVPAHYELTSSTDRRIWVSCLGAAVFVWALYAAAAPVRLQLTGGIGVTLGGAMVGTAVSMLLHLTVFTLIALALSGISGIGALNRSAGVAEYWLLFVLTAATVAVTLASVVLAPISIRGASASAVAFAIGLSVAASWSGIVRYRLKEARTPRSALDAWLSPVGTSTGRRSTAATLVGLLLVAVVSQTFVARVATFDWEFMLQKLCALCVWLVSFSAFYASVRDLKHTRVLWVAPAVVLGLFAGEQIALPRAASFTHDAGLTPEFVLDGYAAVDPSFRMARDVLGSSAGQDGAEFYSYLRANSTIQDEVAPVSVDFAWPGAHADQQPPNIFIFIIDSLRPDYLSPYNQNVPFTPAIRAFANDSYVFTRTFSRYGGTGLSVPSIWAGAMVIHKQYVTPFAPTNALEKLLNANDYRRFITEDHISEALFADTPLSIGLDHNVQEMLHTFCRTATELTNDLRLAPRDGRPVFAMTRPLELHIGNIATATVPAGESYPGFYGPYAARVARIDACFGRFIETLKDLHLYDNSIIVLTGDHGDSLGEGQRWGHGFTVFPEVMRIPLLIHLPPAIQSRVTTDLARVSFSIDLTPTLYALIDDGKGQRAGGKGQRAGGGGQRAEGGGQRAEGGGQRDWVGEPTGDREALLGEPLFVPPSAADYSARRRGSYLVASSYGPVYGLLSQNGRHLYIADGVEGREYAFALSPSVPSHSSSDRRVGITDAERDAARRKIREQIGSLAAWYGFTPGR